MATQRTGTAGDPSRPSSFTVPGYRFVWLAGWVWHVARWMAVFVSSYRMNELTGDPLLVQLVGAAFTAPMFLGGLLAGTITDRSEPRRILVLVLGTLVPLSALMSVVVRAEVAAIATTYVFVFLVGVGNVFDMTARRGLAYEMVGVGLLTNAAALETFALHFGSMVGSVSGGAVLQTFGEADVFVAIGAVYLLAMLSLRTGARHAPARPRHTRPARSRPTLAQDVRSSARLLADNPTLRHFLVFTVLMNFFYYAFVPLVPVFAEELEVGALLTGLLAGAIGAGTMTGALVFARVQTSRRGLAHIVGVIGAMSFLVVFAQMSWYPTALAALFLAGLFGSGFGTTQSALVVDLVDDAQRGRALGLLSMAIGALPFGNFTLGLVARQTDPSTAVTVSVATGLAFVIAWQARHPSLRRL